MLKLLLIWAVVATPPFSGPTVSYATQASRPLKRKFKADENRIPFSPPKDSEKKDTNPTSQSRQEQGAQHPITVLVPEPLKIDAVKDWRDRTTWVLSLSLTLFTAFQVWYLKKTLDVVAEQARIMAEQSRTMKESVIASRISAEAALTQIKMTEHKERARIVIKAGAFSVEKVSPATWYLNAVIDVLNTGNSRAFITDTSSNLFVVEDWNEHEIHDSGPRLIFTHDVLDPDKIPVSNNILYMPKSETIMDEIATKFYHSDLHLALSGFIEYETMGTKWHRDFYFVRKPSKGSWIELLGGGPPTTPERKLDSGGWREDYLHPNREQEVVDTPPKRANNII